MGVVDRIFGPKIRAWLVGLFNRIFGPKSGVVWGKYRIPDRLTPYHFLAVGTTGSGKTTLLRMLLRNVLPRVGQGKNARVLLYDPKAEWCTEITDLSLGHRRFIMNPFDARSVAWDMAADIDGEPEAKEIAALMIPTVEGSGKFFYDASRKLLKEAILCLSTLTYDNVLKRSTWEFRDLLLACENVNDLAAMMEKSGRATGSVKEFLTAEREATSVRMTLSVENDSYNSIAAAWHNAGHKVSLREWVEGESILLLGASKQFRTSLATVNRLVLQRLQQLLMDHYDPDPERRSWFVIDEFPSLGHIPYFEELLTEGRGRGICVVLGFQHIAHVKQHFKDMTEALLGQCHHQAYFSAQDKELARWISDRFIPLAERDYERPWAMREMAAVRVGEIMELEPASPRDGFHCIIKSVREVVDGPKLIHVRPSQGPPLLRPVKPGDKDYAERAGFIRRDRRQLVLEPWSAKERKAFGLAEMPEPGLPWPVVQDADLIGLADLVKREGW
jgi:hypothetical protein